MLQDILAKLERADAPDHKYPDAKGEYWTLCPFHNDHRATNFSVSERGYKCFVCGAQGGLVALARKLGVAVLQRCSVAGGVNTPPLPLSLEEYARAKRLPLAFLQSLGLETIHLPGGPEVKMPYYDTAGVEAAVRLRLTMAGDRRFRWRKGSRVLPYGLWKLAEAQTAGYVLLVEGESDAQTLWYYHLPALGIPGATTWQAAWAEYVRGLAVYIWQEPDAGGALFAQETGKSVPESLVISPPPGRKDISECHILGDDVPSLVKTLMAKAVPRAQIAQEARSRAIADAEAIARPLLECPDLLSAFAKLCPRLGLVGEERNAKLLYLALTSRLLEEPVSMCIKGPSGGGKSFLVETVLKAFPPSAYYALSSMSERSLAYSEETLCHRFLVLYEATGLSSDLATYLVRSLLSEGHIRYETVEKTRDGLKPRLIERSGPTGLIVTTTWASLHPDNETRLLSVAVRDDTAQTAAVFQALADRAKGQVQESPDLEPWRALQSWLELAGVCAVDIPFSDALARLANPAAVRLRRDFGKLLTLIQTHALLHQRHRQRNERGHLLATVDDYAAVYELMADIVGEGVEATVSKAIRETVMAVYELSECGEKPVSLTELAAKLGLDKATVSRRVRVAIEHDYLVNMEEKRGRPAKLLLGEPLPEEKPVLPAPEMLRGEGE